LGARGQPVSASCCFKNFQRLLKKLYYWQRGTNTDIHPVEYVVAPLAPHPRPTDALHAPTLFAAFKQSLSLLTIFLERSLQAEPTTPGPAAATASSGGGSKSGARSGASGVRSGICNLFSVFLEEHILFREF
jgi:hypothetical protein